MVRKVGHGRDDDLMLSDFLLMCQNKRRINQSTSPKLITTGVAGAALVAGGVVRLANGWWISGAIIGSPNCDIQFHVSKDNGYTWSLLCTLDLPAFDYNSFHIKMCSVGTKVYTLIVVRNWTVNYCCNFDATAITPGTIMAYTNKTYCNSIVTAQSSFYYGCDISADKTGTLWAIWSAKNTTGSPNCYDLYAAKSVDGIIWTKFDNTPGFTQVTSQDNYHNSYPRILYDADTDSLYIPYVHFSSVSNYTYVRMFNNSPADWATSQPYAWIFYDAGYYTQADSNVLLTSTGHKLMVWDGSDSGIGIPNIFFIDEEPSGPYARTKLTSDASIARVRPTIIEEGNANVDAVWIKNDGTGIEGIKIQPSIGNPLANPVSTLVSGTGITSFAACENYKSFDDPIIIFITQEGLKFRGIFYV